MDTPLKQRKKIFMFRDKPFRPRNVFVTFWPKSVYGMFSLKKSFVTVRYSLEDKIKKRVRTNFFFLSDIFSNVASVDPLFRESTDHGPGLINFPHLLKNNPSIVQNFVMSAMKTVYSILQLIVQLCDLYVHFLKKKRI